MSYEINFFGDLLPFAFPIILYVISVVLLFRPVPIVNFAIGGFDLVYCLFLVDGNEFFVMFSPWGKLLLIIIAVLMICSGFYGFNRE